MRPTVGLMPTSIMLLEGVRMEPEVSVPTLAAHRLAAFENLELNRRRILLRRIGGGAMFLLGVAFFAGFELMDHQKPVLFALTWMGVALLMLFIVVLGLIDLRLTMRLRRRDRDDP